MFDLRLALEIKFKEGISDLQATLPREDIHAATSHGNREIATSWGSVALLFNLFPLTNVTLQLIYYKYRYLPLGWACLIKPLTFSDIVHISFKRALPSYPA